MPPPRKTKIDNALDNFYSTLGDLASNKKETPVEEVQPEYVEEPIPEVELSKHTFSERKIIKNYQKKPLSQRSNMNPLQTCKVCGQQVPSSEMSAHVRIELMDPKYFTQKKNERERNKNPNNDAQISRHLKELASRRTDIFGEDEVEIGREIGEDQRQAKKRDREKVIWDGHTANAAGGQGPSAPPQGTTNAWGGGTTVQEQIAAIHSKKGLLQTPHMGGMPQAMPPPPMGMSQGMPPPPMGMPPPHHMAHPPHGPPMGGMPQGMPPPPMGMPPRTFSQPPVMHNPPAPHGMQRPPAAPPAPPQNIQEPPAKRMKPEKTYIPAEEFIAKSAEKIVRAKVECPNMAEKEGVKLNGQVITLQMSLADTVIQLKEKLEQAVGVKPNKQKLVIKDGTILKDQSSFADLNLAGDLQISLKLKERGGKK